MKNFDRNLNEYRENVHASNHIDIFNFDRTICTLLLTNIQNVERVFNASIAYCISHKLNELNYQYANILEVDKTLLNKIFISNKSDEDIKDLLVNSFKRSNSNLFKKYEKLREFNKIQVL